MVYANTKAKGSVAEVEVMCFLSRAGYHVCLPFGENAPYDLVAESPTGRLYRIQVRLSTWKGDTISLSLRVISKNYCRTIDRTRIDAFALWDGQDVYLIPVADTKDWGNSLLLRRAPAKNGQTKRIRMASSYLGFLAAIP